MGEPVITLKGISAQRFHTIFAVDLTLAFEMRLFLTVGLLLIVTLLQAQSSESVVNVNTEYDEQDPVISPDGLTMFFTIGNHPQNVGGKKDPGDIWFSRLAGGQWSAPIHAGAVLNNSAYNAVAGISGGGDQLILHGHYDASGEPARSQGISVSRNDGNGWSQPVNIQIPYYLNRSGLLSGTMSADGTIFIFSADTYGTRGVEDLYVSFNENGKWSEPRNLGPTINTQFQEFSPSLSPDNKTLYFSSNGMKGNGSFDVYSSVRLDETWRNWSMPVNMGDRINTTGRELFFRLSPDGTGIYTSTVNSDGYGDIKLYIPEQPFFERDTAVLAQAVEQVDTVVAMRENHYDTATSSPYVTVHGKVMNAKTGEPIPATITFRDSVGLDTMVEASMLGYTTAVGSTATYTIAVEAQGFVSTMQTLDINTFEMKELEMNFSLQPAEKGTTVNLKNVLFAQSRAEILPESYPELDLVVAFLKANPDIRIELAGHTDNRGVHADNVKLSHERVKKVKEYLVAHGIDSRRITGKGFGGSKPVASNDTEESRRLNRRVEFTITKS